MFVEPRKYQHILVTLTVNKDGEGVDLKTKSGFGFDGSLWKIIGNKMTDTLDLLGLSQVNSVLFIYHQITTKLSQDALYIEQV